MTEPRYLSIDDLAKLPPDVKIVPAVTPGDNTTWMTKEDAERLKNSISNPAIDIETKRSSPEEMIRFYEEATGKPLLPYQREFIDKIGTEFERIVVYTPPTKSMKSYHLDLDLAGKTGTTVVVDDQNEERRFFVWPGDIKHGNDFHELKSTKRDEWVRQYLGNWDHLDDRGPATTEDPGIDNRHHRRKRDAEWRRKPTNEKPKKFRHHDHLRGPRGY